MRIDTDECLVRRSFLSERKQRAHPQRLQAARERESLYHPAGDAQARKRSRTLAIGDALQITEPQPGLSEQCGNRAQYHLGMPLAGFDVIREHRITATHRERQELRGGFDCQQIHVRRERLRVRETNCGL
jgi:hypothetical protein